MHVKTVNTHDLLISAIAEKQLLRTYAYYLKFKYQFSSSRLNGANRCQLSRLTGVSEKTVRIQVNKMILLGWAKHEGQDLVFVSLKTIYKKFRLPYKRLQYVCKIGIKVFESVGDIITKLASRLVEANLYRQRYILEVKQMRYSSSSKGLNSKDKEILSKYANEPFGMSEAHDTTMSCKRFGSLIGRSRSVGYLLKKKMQEMGLIEVLPNISLVRDVRFIYPLFLKMKNKYPEQNLFYSKGKVFTRGADRISMNAFAAY